MKYVAILKDSLREALDSKVLYVMFGLSTLVIILVGSLSFKPLSAEKTMERFFWSEMKDPFGGKETREVPPLFSTGMKGKNKDKDKDELQETIIRLASAYPYRLVKVDVVSGAEDAPESAYALTVSRIIPKKIDIGLFGDDPNKRAQVIRELFKEAETFGYLQVENVENIAIEDPAKETARFRVTVKGTPKTQRIWVTEATWFFGVFELTWMRAPLGMQLTGLASLVIGIGSWVTVLVGIVISSFFFPNMLRKGTIDFLLVKPVQRWALLLYKYVGGLTFIFLCTSYTLLGIWLVLGIRSGLWPNGSLLLVFTLTFFFSILYAISTFVGVLTRSTVTSIMLTLLAYTFLGGAGLLHIILEANVKMEEAQEKTKELTKLMKKVDDKGDDRGHNENATRWADSYWVKGSRILNAMLPRTEDLNQLNSMIIATDFMSGNLADIGRFDTGERNWWVSLLVSVIWIGIFLGLSALWFTLKDY